MCEVILALDAGGTSIKAGVLRGEEMLAKRTFPFAGEEREAMLAVFRQALAWGRAYAPACLGMACPGPFDFARGVSHMRHKWRGLKDVPLPPVFARELPGVPQRFLHDSTAFLLGEAWQGAAQEMKNPAGVMLGTGFGFAVMADRRVLVDANGTPALVLWNAPFRDRDGGGLCEPPRPAGTLTVPRRPTCGRWRSGRAGETRGPGRYSAAWGGPGPGADPLPARRDRRRGAGGTNRPLGGAVPSLGPRPGGGDHGAAHRQRGPAGRRRVLPGRGPRLYQGGVMHERLYQAAGERLFRHGKAHCGLHPEKRAQAAPGDHQHRGPGLRYQQVHGGAAVQDRRFQRVQGPLQPVAGGAGPERSEEESGVGLRRDSPRLHHGPDLPDYPAGGDALRAGYGGAYGPGPPWKRP